MNTKPTPLASLKPHPKNVRVGDVQLIKESLQHHGQYRPIVVQESTNHILAGNHTFKAAKELGWDTIEATFIDVDNDQALRILLMDNRANDKATYDTDELVGLLDQLLDTDLELTGTGFSMGDLDDLLADLNTPDKDLGDVDEIPKPPVVPVSKLGDVWLLGKHRLMCGDSTDLPTVERLMNGVKADMVFTDPPYGVSYTGGLQFKNGHVEKNNREMIKNDDVDIYEGVLKVLSKVTTGACYIWFAGTKASALYQAAEQYGDIHALIIWVKNGGYGALNANYKQKHEPCLYWKPKNASLKFTGATTETTIWEIDKDGKNKLHPTQKPVALAAKALSNHEAKTVLDLFGGSGSTLIAAEQTNRTAYIMELDPQYVDVICKRYQQTTGTQPILEATGKTYDFSVE